MMKWLNEQVPFDPVGDGGPYTAEMWPRWQVIGFYSCCAVAFFGILFLAASAMWGR